MTDLFTRFDTRLDQAFDEVALELASGSLTKVSLLSCTENWLGLTFAGQLAPMSLACSRSSLARPYICRLMSFRRVICPSVWPLDHGETMGTRFRVERPAQGDVVVTARPLELSAIHAGAGALALFLAHPGSEAHTDPQLLRALLGLTMAEARLAAVLCEGLSLVEAAQRLGIAHNTAKVQLRAVFAKTGVRRQAQLVALMGSLGLGFAGAGFEAGADGEQTNARDGLLTFC